VFKRAGFDWREAGCSMCLGMNPDQLMPQERCASTSNRNFEGRQGAGGRTHLLSPAMAAAAAISGYLTDVRKFLGNEPTETEVVIKVLRPEAFLTDPVTAPPVPQGALAKAGELPPSSTPSVGHRFTVVRGIAAPIKIQNVDTDMIIPKQFLKTLKRTGLGSALFFAKRKDPVTGEATDFVLNRAPFDKSKIIVCTGENFGCGSSREHAPWSLNDFGIMCVIAPSFGDIFRTNMMQNGMLPIQLPKAICQELALDAELGAELEVDLERQVIRRPGGKPDVAFAVDSFRRHCLLNGLDDIGLTMQKADSIEEFESRRSQVWPWLDGFGYKGSKIAVTQGAKQGKKMDW